MNIIFHDINSYSLLSFVIAEVRKVTIIGDSIIKHIYGINGCTVQSFRGHTISKLTNKIEHKLMIKLQGCCLMTLSLYMLARMI